MERRIFRVTTVVDYSSLEKRIFMAHLADSGLEIGSRASVKGRRGTVVYLESSGLPGFLFDDNQSRECVMPYDMRPLSPLELLGEAAE